MLLIFVVQSVMRVMLDAWLTSSLCSRCVKGTEYSNNSQRGPIGNSGNSFEFHELSANLFQGIFKIVEIAYQLPPPRLVSAGGER